MSEFLKDLEDTSEEEAQEEFKVEGDDWQIPELSDKLLCDTKFKEHLQRIKEEEIGDVMEAIKTTNHYVN